MEVSEELDWGTSEKDFATFQQAFKDFSTYNDKVRDTIKSVKKQLDKHRRSNKDFANMFHKELKSGKITAEEYAKRLEALASRNQLCDKVALALPMHTGMFLNTFLGTVNVTLPDMGDRFKYKSEYEDMKFNGTIVILAFTLLAFYMQSRNVDMVLQLVLGAYYAIVTVRELILIANGSHIKFWWRLHHYLAILQSLVLAGWPESAVYRQFREQFLMFTLYLAVVQLLQFQYQKYQLYTKRSLGRGDMMETTTDLPNRSTFSVLIIALFLAYLFQLTNSYTLFTLASVIPGAEWQVYACGLLFGILGIGNVVTTLIVLHRKYVVSHPTNKDD